MGFDLDPDYVDVAERIRLFREKHPDGSLQPLNHDQPFTVVDVGNKTFVVYTAAAYRTPDDPRPGVGIAWEPFPGPTPYTKDSELMNAETGAWGRAIVAVLAAETKKVASAEEVRNRRADEMSKAARGGGEERAHTSGSTAAGSTSNSPPRPATDKQRKFIERLVDKTGMVPEVWPLADDLSMPAAAKLIDWLQDQPVEPLAERAATVRAQLGAEEVDEESPF